MIKVPAPEYIIRGNKVKCTYCGLALKTRVKYVSHFIRRHMNPDGTWREAKHNFDFSTPKEAKPWWEL
jgi:DTW domain-containing protein YfiP